MASGTFLNNSTSFSDTITLSKPANTHITLLTAGKYVEKIVELTLNAQTASPSFNGGALNYKGADATFTNMTTSTSNTSGVVIQTNGTAGRDAVLYNGSVEGWVSKESETPALSAMPTENWTGTTYYATGVVLGAGKQFSITIPNGENLITLVFNVDENGKDTVITALE